MALLHLSPSNPSRGGRIYNLSLVRMTAVAAILLCHFVQYYKWESLALWLNVGVDVFLVLSGYLYGMRSFRFASHGERIRFALRFYYKEFLKLFIPYYVMLALTMPAYFLMGKASLHPIGKALLLVNEGLPGFFHLWFFRFLVICYFFTPFWYFIPERPWKNAFLLFVFVLLLPLSGTGIVWILCYLLGMVLARTRLFAGNCPKAKCILDLLVVATGIVLSVWCIVKNVDRSEYDLLLNTQKLFLGGGILVTLTLLFKQEYFGPWMQKVLEVSDATSYELFLVHPLFLSGAFCVMRLAESKTIAIVLCLLCIAISTVALFWISKRLTQLCLSPLNSKNR